MKEGGFETSGSVSTSQQQFVLVSLHVFHDNDDDDDNNNNIY
jgi:hypothetical protein